MLSKNLGFNTAATLARDGTLTLTTIEQIDRVEDGSLLEEPAYTTTTMMLSAQETRALLNLLHSPEGRARIGARLQKEGKRHDAKRI